jgi:uncharacterized membrane protein
MSLVEKTVDVDVPISVAYNQWTQFEDFPQFMEGVEEVRQIDDQTLQWHVNIGGADRTFQARIEEQEPDRRIAWRATEGEEQAGVVTFQPVGDATTRIRLEMSYDPEQWTEKVADFLNIIERRVQGDLERFKTFIEERGDETGAWRGRIEDGDVRDSDSPQEPPRSTGSGTPPTPGAGDVPTHGGIGDASPGGEPHERE